MVIANSVLGVLDAIRRCDPSLEQFREEILMILRMSAVVSLLLLAACAGSSTRIVDPSAGGDCLYVTQDGSSGGRQTKWASCSSPPPLAIGIISGHPSR